MTIKEFAKLCGCNEQTLRYYDRIDLLKPMRVDKWSGYRYYDDEQALVFVKIKDLQLAGFSIEEIKSLLEQSDETIYKAFEQKIAEQQEKLNLILQIQKSYETEMKKMKDKIKGIRERVLLEMERYDPSEEFGIDRDTYETMIRNVISSFEELAAEGNYEDYNFEEYSNDPLEMEEHYDFFEDLDYKLVCEKHGWKVVKEFIRDYLKLDDGYDYDFVFKVTDEKEKNSAFPNIVLAMVLMENEKDPNEKRNLGCTITNSKDGENHFWLFKKESKKVN
ncbi:MAG: MerR family transcriptional regulator [Oscillospiraceae bacterium]|nr:MerR family transcriptional regulator [Oscillospiraceae bacterium]